MSTPAENANSLCQLPLEHLMGLFQLNQAVLTLVRLGLTAAIHCH